MQQPKNVKNFLRFFLEFPCANLPHWIATCTRHQNMQIEGFSSDSSAAHMWLFQSTSAIRRTLRWWIFDRILFKQALESVNKEWCTKIVYGIWKSWNRPPPKAKKKCYISLLCSWQTQNTWQKSNPDICHIYQPKNTSAVLADWIRNWTGHIQFSQKLNPLLKKSERVPQEPPTWLPTGFLRWAKTVWQREPVLPTMLAAPEQIVAAPTSIPSLSLPWHRTQTFHSITPVRTTRLYWQSQPSPGLF